MHRTKFMLMPKATFKSALLVLIILPLLLTSCSDPGAEKDQQLQEAAKLTASGQYDAALEQLNQVAVHHPNDPAVLLRMSEVYEAQGDAPSQAFILQQVQPLKPDDVELLYQTYLAHKKANQPTLLWLEKLATQSPDTVSAQMWIELGAERQQAGQTQLALDAYLKGANPDSIEADTATAIGQLFLQLDNSAQAERWFHMAADTGEPSALTALFGLLQVNIKSKNWPETEAIVEQLNAQFPGAVEASQWADVPAQLKTWRDAQAIMQAKLKQEAEAKAAAEAKAKAEAKAAALAEAEKAKAATEATEQNSDTAESDSKVAEPKPGTPSITKSQVIADLEAAEAMANAPALEADPTNSEQVTTDNATTFDPSIAVRPADPDLSVDIDFDQEANGATVSYTSNTIAKSTPTLPLPVEPDVELIDELSASIETAFSTPPENIAIDERDAETILAEAGTAEVDRDYKRAIRLYWQALGKENNRADIWNLLSRAYLVENEINNAETTALEAIRFAPSEVRYTLDYLRIIQRTKKPTDFLAELETAYDRFPRSPEIALSLARAYERITENTTSAYAFYERFIELAPGHPLRKEAEAALDRLR